MKKVNLLLSNKQNVFSVTKELKELIYYCCRLVLHLEKFKHNVEISVLLTDNNEIKKLNYKYRNKNFPTDVLSFSNEPFYNNFNYEDFLILGDIVISVERAMEQLEEFESNCIEEEIARLIIHSVLHLLGYDHEKGELDERVMQSKERIINKIVKNKFKFEKRK